MSLHVYDWLDEQENSIPLEVILENDIFFDLNTEIPNTELARFFLEYIDKAKYHNGDFFIDRDGSLLRRECLSTGCKTAINIISHPKCCFSTIECGKNARYAILKACLGSVLWLGGSVSICEDTCDIMYKNQGFKSIQEFINFYEEV